MGMNNQEIEFQLLYEQFYPQVLRYLKDILGDEAEDATQEVFLKVHRGLPSFRGNSGIWTWIYRIATNTALDRRRKHASRQDYEANHCPDDLPDSSQVSDAFPSIQASPAPDEFLVRQEMNDCIRTIVEKLPEMYHTVILLKELRGLKNQEIANLLDITLDTVKIRLHRARQQLRKSLEVNCQFYRNEDNEFACEPKCDFPE
jgi:RNA polymerase sigma-70 factor (ECF subfamily)